MNRSAILWVMTGLLLGVAPPSRADQELGSGLVAAGLSPACFAAVGLSGPEVAAVLQRMQGSPELTAVSASRTDLEQRRQQLVQLRQDVNPLDGAGAAALAQAVVGVEQSRVALTAATDALIVAGCSGCGGTCTVRIGQWRGNTTTLPPEFRVALWTPEQLRALQRALARERVSQAAGSPPPADAAAVLAEARARAEVVEATASLSAHLADITAAVEQATH
jgi:hypothetical protein